MGEATTRATSFPLLRREKLLFHSDSAVSQESAAVCAYTGERLSYTGNMHCRAREKKREGKDNDKKCLCGRKMRNNLGFFQSSTSSFHHVFIRWIQFLFCCVRLASSTVLSRRWWSERILSRDEIEHYSNLFTVGQEIRDGNDINKRSLLDCRWASVSLTFCELLHSSR